MHSFDLGGPGVYQRGPKFEIKHKSRRLQRVSLLIGGGGGKHVDWKGQAPPGPFLSLAVFSRWSLFIAGNQPQTTMPSEKAL